MLRDCVRRKHTLDKVQSLTNLALVVVRAQLRLRIQVNQSSTCELVLKHRLLAQTHVDSPLWQSQDKVPRRPFWLEVGDLPPRSLLVVLWSKVRRDSVSDHCVSGAGIDEFGLCCETTDDLDFGIGRAGSGGKCARIGSDRAKHGAERHFKGGRECEQVDCVVVGLGD